MASFCYVCGTATPAGLNRETGEVVTTTMRSGIGPADLIRKLQRALGPGYELQERIGAGGFAEVFRARDLRLKRDLAVKVLRPDLGLSPDLLQRFRREAETIATLRNAHIVPVYDIGEAEGLAFIIMPLITGESLRAMLDRDGALPPDATRRILREAARGLAAAHEAGVIHRDIKPENIMLEGREQRVLLMDFGIAKAVGFGGADDNDPGATLTTTGIIIGTPQYMSPEQACGDKTIDARSDQYSLAVVGYRMLAGGLPFEGESTRAVLYQQLVAEPPPIATKVPGVPAPLAEAIQRAMAKEPNDRYADMAAFADALDDSAITASTVPVTAPRAPIPHRTLPIAGAIAAVCVLAAGGWWIAGRRHDAPPPPPQVIAPQLATTSPVTVVPQQIVVAPPPPAPVAEHQPESRNRTKAGTPLGSTGNSKHGTTAASAAPATTPVAPAVTGCVKLAAASNWTAAVAACTAQANANDPAAARTLAKLYDGGLGVPANPVLAVTWYRKAGADPEAEFLLSHMVDIGRGTPQNGDEAVTLLRQAATAGWLRAQQVLAYRLQNGAGMHKDETEAASWYRKAAEHGDVISQQNLADMLAKGHGVPKNETEALSWYRKAADQGSGDAAWQAAQMYFKGHGTERNDTTGMVWLKKAATLNQPDAMKELKKRTSN
jgi:serine/threonine-protein kinase